jgi:hypothetical protein
MFTAAQLVDLRRFLGYSIYGAAPSPMNGYRFFTAYGTMEYRLRNMSAEEQTVVVNVYLAALYTLEQAIVKSSGNLDTDRAAVWFHNKNEVTDRYTLFNSWRQRLADFVGLPLGDRLSSSRHSAAMVV